jgi:hypothetical protein
MRLASQRNAAPEEVEVENRKKKTEDHDKKISN